MEGVDGGGKRVVGDVKEIGGVCVRAGCWTQPVPGWCQAWMQWTVRMRRRCGCMQRVVAAGRVCGGLNAGAGVCVCAAACVNGVCLLPLPASLMQPMRLHVRYSHSRAISSPHSHSHAPLRRTCCSHPAISRGHTHRVTRSAELVLPCSSSHERSGVKATSDDTP